MSVRAALVLLISLLALPRPGVAGAAATTPRDILNDPTRFDGQAVTITGVIDDLRARVPARGTPVYTFFLNDGYRRITVFSSRAVSCGEGEKATVDGIFATVRRRSGDLFYDEVDATGVTCR